MHTKSPLNTAFNPNRIPSFYGWHLLGAYPDQEVGDVGSWLLYSNGEAMLLETPPGLEPKHIAAGLAQLNCTLKYVTTSHLHLDHYTTQGWSIIRKAFPKATYLRPNGGPIGCMPGYLPSEARLPIGKEVCWFISAPKHSRSDQVVVFRGVAHTGDIELGMIDSVTTGKSRVPEEQRRASMLWLQGFQQRTDYRVHTTVSAHLNDIRQNVVWEDLFRV